MTVVASTVPAFRRSSNTAIKKVAALPIFDSNGNARAVSRTVPYWEKSPLPYAAQVGSRFGLLSADRTSRCYRHAKMLQVQSGNGL